MNPRIFLVMIVFGISFFYAGLESLARFQFNWILQPLIVMVWLGGLMMLLFGLFGAYYVVSDELMLIFPEHLVRMWKGVNKSLGAFTSTDASKEEKN